MRHEFHKDPTSTEVTETKLRKANANASRPSRPPVSEVPKTAFPVHMRGGLTHRQRRMKVTLPEKA